MLRKTLVEINLDRLARNIREMKRLAGHAQVMAVVKADAYGHGAIQVARTCLAHGVTRLAVATAEEGLELRQAGMAAPILVLGPSNPDKAEVIVRNYLSQTVFNRETAEALSKAAQRMERVARIHLKIETGMNRLGISPGLELEAFLNDLTRLPGLKVEGVFTHLSSADEASREYTLKQLEALRGAVAQIKAAKISGFILHAGNSAALLGYPEAHLDCVRPGLSLYGYLPSERFAGIADIRPVLSWRTVVAHLHDAPKGSSIGYNRTFVTRRHTKVATLPVGYADGYNRLLSNRGEVLVRGHRAPIIGRVCMDQCMVDVTNVPEVAVGDMVTLLGRDGSQEITADDLAAWTGTIAHEILTSIGPRVHRIYREKGRLFTVDSRTGEQLPFQF